MNSRPTIALAVLLFTAGIGADNCGVYWPSASTAPPPPPQSTKPCCYTDPPAGCAAVCKDLGDISFTDACVSVAAGPATVDFQTKVDQASAMLPMPPCDEASLGKTITPCQIGIMPAEWPNQDHDVCMPPPPGCVATW
jgi:hypothetical protein